MANASDAAQRAERTLTNVPTLALAWPPSTPDFVIGDSAAGHKHVESYTSAFKVANSKG